MKGRHYMDNCHNGARKRHRSAEELGGLIRRLNIIEGQVRGVRGMLEEDAYCPDILVQISAISSALDSLSGELLGSHIRSCVVNDIKAGRSDSADELSALVKRLLKS